MTETLVTEESIEQLLHVGHTLEPINHRAEIERIEREYDGLRHMLDASSNGQHAELVSELERLNRLLTAARTDYAQAAARQRYLATS
jgi:hypothetical protein